MKQRVVLIGGGQIVTHYKEGLEASPIFEVVALCDLDEACPARALFPNLPFYKDFQKAIEELGPDGAIVAVATKAHYGVVVDCLRMGIDVYVEKPIATTKEETKRIFAIAEEAGKRIVPLFHWRYADEVLFLEKYLMGKRIYHVSVHICDDYACEPCGKIRPDRLGLGGAWLDSGINALSYIDQILTFNCMAMKSKEERFDEESKLPYYSSRRFQVSLLSDMEITVDWSTPSRKKESRIVLDDEEIFVDHTEQKVWSDKGVLFHKKVADRLSAHYVNLFSARELLGEFEMYDGEYLHDVLFLDEGIL